jgi:hypothetical protein
MSYFETKHAAKPVKVLVPRSAQRLKEKSKNLPFISPRESGLRIHKPILQNVCFRKNTEFSDLISKANNTKISVIKEMFQEKFNNLKSVNFPFHNLSKQLICSAGKKESLQRKLSNKSPVNGVKVTSFRRFVSVKPLSHRKECNKTPSPVKGCRISPIEHSKSFRKFNTKTAVNTKRECSDSDEDRMDTSVYSDLYLNNV